MTDNGPPRIEPKTLSHSSELLRRYEEVGRNLAEIHRKFDAKRLSLLESCHVDVNGKANSGVKETAALLGLEPFVLKLILEEIIPYSFQEDEFLQKRLSELLVYVKLKYAERIKEIVDEEVDEANRSTKSEIARFRGRFAQLEDNRNAMTKGLDQKQAELDQNLMALKRKFIKQVNMALAQANGHDHLLNADDSKVIQRLEERDMIGRSGRYRLINQDKILFLSMAEYCDLMDDLL